ncbi:DUF4376 domain-containing protein [Solimicrobium silvestre]|uniref:DUF4376 domain-containing protein n=1 Tax=Solimicrobium silvestre TaxID=2099400 RepID=A0A2S9GZD9_9BURK|nr:DUF4376 domain-containing protein [Solimicrobium silvestre]PRC93102.1 hypothetical protein S2091_2188 [Solimicrobium silvestre]
MINYVMHDSKTGEIIQWGTCSDGQMHEYKRDGVDVVEGDGNPDTHFVENGLIHLYSDIELSLKNNVPEGFIWKMPERILVDQRDLSMVKEQAWNRIKNERNLAESANFICNGAVYQADKERIPLAMQTALQAKLDGTVFTIDWVLADNSTITLTASDMINVGTALNKQMAEVNEKSQRLRQEIHQATSIAEIDLINWV